MSPVTVRANAEIPVAVPDSEDSRTKAEFGFEEISEQTEFKSANAANQRTKNGGSKVDAAYQALADRSGSLKGANHKSSRADDEPAASKKETRRSNTRGSQPGRNSEESVRSSGRKSSEGRKSQDGNSQRKSTDSQRSTGETVQDEASDQLSQITDILLARLITTLSDSTLGNPALLLQALLGFSPDDYNDLLAALSESRLSYVDIISAYLHNIRVMSEDSGSTSAALSGTLTRSLIEQYNGLLAQAVKSPQNIARASMIGDSDGRSHLIDLLHKANADTKADRHSAETGLPKGPYGLGFGRRHVTESSKRQQMMTDKATSQPDGGFADFNKLFGTLSKFQTPDATSGFSSGLSGIPQEQLASFLQNTGMLSAGYGQGLSYLPNVGGMSGMLSMSNPYAVPQIAPWSVPMHSNGRTAMGWNGGAGFGQSSLLRGWGGSGLETVHENLSSQLRADHLVFPQAINMQQQPGQQS